MIQKEMLELAKKMVRIPSVNSTGGEKKIGVFIESYIRNIPYFKQHPEQVIVQELKQDPLNRRNVFALLIGEKERCSDTLLFHGHTDTVGIEDYGELGQAAFEPDLLAQQLSKMNLDQEVERDLLSGDYMFGRGACDMKSGDAVFLEILKEMAQKADELSGNILLSLNPVEENLHTGIIEGLEVLNQMKEQYDLNYILAINNDFICPLYPGDELYTIYTGTVGKLLPCFYIQGKETHVGQCFEGFDASMVAAGLVDDINLNTRFSDGYCNEYSYPPSVLKMKDLKLWYNVQTASEAFVYFNYFVHNASMQKITGQLKESAEKVLRASLDKINQKNQEFCYLSNQVYQEYQYPLQVFTYEELLLLAKNSPRFLEKSLQEILENEIKNKIDQREIPIAMIRYLLYAADITTPCIVLYYAAPYCPHNTLQGIDEKLITDLQIITEKITKNTGENFRFMKFFPSLSDSSYLKIDDTDASIQTLIENFPGYEKLYPVPLDQIKKLNIPAVNYGCYGKDAHKWTERVHIPYTFGILPELIRETVNYYLK